MGPARKRADTKKILRRARAAAHGGRTCEEALCLLLIGNCWPRTGCRGRSCWARCCGGTRRHGCGWTKSATSIARRHRISSRRRLAGLPNNRLAHDLPGYIATMAAGYLVGSPVRYAPPDGPGGRLRTRPPRLRRGVRRKRGRGAGHGRRRLRQGRRALLRRRLRPAQGRPDGPQKQLRRLRRHRGACPALRRGLPRSPRRTAAPPRRARSRSTGRTPSSTFERAGSETPREVGRQAHYFGGVPMVEYWNNAREQGDFEPVMGLIDAYDALQSDRVNDKQQFTDAVFVLKGVGALGIDDTEEEAGRGTAEARRARGQGRRGPQRAPAAHPHALSCPATGRTRSSSPSPTPKAATSCCA